MKNSVKNLVKTSVKSLIVVSFFCLTFACENSVSIDQIKLKDQEKLESTGPTAPRPPVE